MANTKEFLDKQGISYLWTRIKSLLDLKADKSEIEALQARIAALESIDSVEVYGGSASKNVEEAND